MRIKIDEETHRYYLDYPSVSEIVNRIVPLDFGDTKQEYIVKGILKGKCVHSLAETYIKTNEEKECPHDVKTHQEAWIWLKEQIDIFIEEADKENDIYQLISEKSMLCESYCFLGTPDLYFLSNLRRKIIIIDFKTGSQKFEREYCQLKLYEILINDCDFYLKPTKIKYQIWNTKTKEKYDPSDFVDTDYLDKRIYEELEKLK